MNEKCLDFRPEKQFRMQKFSIIHYITPMNFVWSIRNSQIWTILSHLVETPPKSPPSSSTHQIYSFILLFIDIKSTQVNSTQPTLFCNILCIIHLSLSTFCHSRTYSRFLPCRFVSVDFTSLVDFISFFGIEICIICYCYSLVWNLIALDTCLKWWYFGLHLSFDIYAIGADFRNSFDNV